MPTWLTMQIIIGLSWFTVWSVIGIFRYARVGYPFNKKDAFKIVYYFYFPCSYLLTIILVESFILIKGGFKFFNTAQLIIPSILLITLVSEFLYYKKKKVANQKIEQRISTKRQECLKWFDKFTFIDESKIKIQIYNTNQSIKGKAIVRDVTSEEAMELKKFEELLPQNISLLIVKKKLILN
ncbi:hypothetical protein [Bacillus cereus]|uniref:hypothetical protein n=1 Tax=Bacillus cereus TaxID=1396 RepID=UPI0018F40B10|nr:hypothetical protein [Bacillus cereus]